MAGDQTVLYSREGAQPARSIPRRTFKQAGSRFPVNRGLAQRVSPPGSLKGSATGAVNPAPDIQSRRGPVSRDSAAAAALERETGLEPATSTLGRSRSAR